MTEAVGPNKLSILGASAGMSGGGIKLERSFWNFGRAIDSGILSSPSTSPPLIELFVSLASRLLHRLILQQELVV